MNEIKVLIEMNQQTGIVNVKANTPNCPLAVYLLEKAKIILLQNQDEPLERRIEPAVFIPRGGQT